MECIKLIINQNRRNYQSSAELMVNFEDITRVIHSFVGKSNNP